MARVPVYDGDFGSRQAERLLWRLGFGPKRGEAKRLARKSLREAVHSLTRPKAAARLRGPRPKDDGDPIYPRAHYGHDVLWWLDRMVRTSQPGVERMALIWHDWFATGDVGYAGFSIDQAILFRKRALGSFKHLFEGVTTDPAMLIWLSGIDNEKDAPNENYGREMMELFALGASNDAGYPYSERDVREQARALTGWDADYDDDIGRLVHFQFDGSLHDKGQKRIFGKRGNFDWHDSVRLCVEHQAHKRYFVERLWSYFIPHPIPHNTRITLQNRYKRSGWRIRPIVEAIAMHPLFYEGDATVKPPAVQIAGMLRARGRGIDNNYWDYLSDRAGQRVFRPPNVSGWDETRWLDTSTYHGRWDCARNVADDEAVENFGSYDKAETPREAVDRALRFWADPHITAKTDHELIRFATRVRNNTPANQQSYYHGLRQNALRMLVATSPDMTTC